MINVILCENKQICLFMDRFRFFTLVFSILILGASCHSSKSIGNNPSKENGKKDFPAIRFLIDELGNGEFTQIFLEEAPEPVQGHLQWVKDFYGSIKYPATARQKSVQGIVKLFVSIDKLGKVGNVSISKGLSPDCDNEARRAFIASTQNGYQPLIYNGQPTAYVMELPVGFWLE